MVHSIQAEDESVSGPGMNDDHASMNIEVVAGTKCSI